MYLIKSAGFTRTSGSKASRETSWISAVYRKKKAVNDFFCRIQDDPDVKHEVVYLGRRKWSLLLVEASPGKFEVVTKEDLKRKIETQVRVDDENAEYFTVYEFNKPWEPSNVSYLGYDYMGEIPHFHVFEQLYRCGTLRSYLNRLSCGERWFA